MKSFEATAVSLADHIPLELPSVAGWKEVLLNEQHELLVPLGPFSEYRDIFTSSIYAGEHSNSPYWSDDRKLDGSLTTQFVRADVADQLRYAQDLLPSNHYLIVLDSYRSLQVQGALYDHYYRNLLRIHPDWNEEALSAETQKYVSVPSRDVTRPSPHNTGGAVDLALFRLPADAAERLTAMDNRLDELCMVAPTNPLPAQEAKDPILREQYLLEMARTSLVRRHGQSLEFGTPFDWGGPEAASNYLEHAALTRQLTHAEKLGTVNRRLLYNVMRAAGLEAYPDEWWHFNSMKSQMGAKAAALDHAEYGAVELSPENQAHEAMRAQHHEGVVRIQETMMRGGRSYGATAVASELIQLNETALRLSGDPRLTHGQIRATVIEPPEA